MEKVNRKKANREFLNMLKTERGCEYCGYNEHPCALQLDHIDPETKFRDKNGKIQRARVSA